jgi:hypothetical protein
LLNANSERITQLVDAYIKIYLAMRESKQWGPYLKGTYINECVLLIAITSIVHDLNNFSVYHDIKTPDRHKRAGFSAYRIAKHKPIHIKNDGEKADVDIGLMYIANEVFAIYTAIKHLKKIPKKPFPFLTEKEFLSFAYTLLYRNVDGPSLSIMFHFFEKTYMTR